jgi:hypothetical protein
MSSIASRSTGHINKFEAFGLYATVRDTQLCLLLIYVRSRFLFHLNYWRNNACSHSATQDVAVKEALNVTCAQIESALTALMLTPRKYL